jgi:hypothetical protein
MTAWCQFRILVAWWLLWAAIKVAPGFLKTDIAAAVVVIGEADVARLL